MMPEDRGGRGRTAWQLKITECCTVPATLGPWVCVLSSHWPCGQVGPQGDRHLQGGRYPRVLTCSPGCLASQSWPLNIPGTLRGGQWP